jgi:hypothetical protein
MDVSHIYQAGTMLWGPFGVATTLSTAPTRLQWWPMDSMHMGDYLWHVPDSAKNVVLSTPVYWNCVSLDLVVRPASWLQAEAGPAVCGMGGIVYTYFGAGPMHGESHHVALAASKALSETARIGARCDAHPTWYVAPRYVVVRLWAGETPGVYPKHWVTPVACGISLTTTTAALQSGHALPVGARVGITPLRYSVDGASGGVQAPFFEVSVPIDSVSRVFIREINPRISAAEHYNTSTANGSDAAFHLAWSGYARDVTRRGRFRAGASAGVWVSGGFDAATWDHGIEAGPFAGGDVSYTIAERDRMHVRGQCSTTVQFGRSHLPFAMPCGLGIEIR